MEGMRWRRRRGDVIRVKHLILSLTVFHFLALTSPHYLPGQFITSKCNSTHIPQPEPEPVSESEPSPVEEVTRVVDVFPQEAIRVRSVDYYQVQVIRGSGSGSRFAPPPFPTVVKLNLQRKKEEELYSSFWIYLLIIFFGLVIISSFVLAFYIIRVSVILICGRCRISSFPHPHPHAHSNLTSHLHVQHPAFSFPSSVPLHLVNYIDADAEAEAN